MGPWVLPGNRIPSPVVGLGGYNRTRVTATPIPSSPPPGSELNPTILRREFPILTQRVNGYPLTYLDNAATTQKPRSVIRALSRFYEEENANVHRGVHELAHRATVAFENARERVRSFLNARSASEIVFTRGTTESINLVAARGSGPQLGPGDRILLTEMEHHSNLVPWQQLAKRTGASLAFWPIDPETGELRREAVEECLTPETRIFSFAQISNVLGTVNPAHWLCEEARRRGILTVIDAAQSASHLPVDVQQLGCDFLAFSGHKACGPTGIGVLYGRRERLESMEPWQGGGEMIESVDWQSSTYAPPPQRFEAGTPPIAGAIGLHAALDFLDEIGRPQIQAHDQRLVAYGVRRLQEIPGLRLLGNTMTRSGVFSFVLEGIHAHDVVTLANEHGIALRGGHHCAQPLLRLLNVSSAVRASTHVYNTAEDLDHLIDVLHEARGLFG